MQFDFSKQPGKILNNKYIKNVSKPLVSVITPFYNAGKFFEQTYNCVLNQTFPYFEWIIVNDGSPNKEDIILLEELCKKDTRIKLFHKDNGGPSSARNFAISETSTEIIIPLDADDLIIPTYFECIYWSLLFNPEASWSYTDSVAFYEKEYLWEKKFDAKIMKTENLLSYCCGIRKDVFVKVGGNDESSKYLYEDWIMWLTLLSKNKFPIRMNVLGFWYRITNTGVLSTINNNPEILANSKRIISEAAKNIDENISAKDYSVWNSIKEYSCKPFKIEWDKEPILNESKHNILMLIPHMELGGADLFNLDIVSKLDKSKYNIGIITTTSKTKKSEMRQRFEEHCTDIFELSTFLDLNNWCAFIHYYIKSRSVRTVFISNSLYGYIISPWLRKEFPDLAIIDYVHSEAWFWKNGGYARFSSALSDILDKTYVCSENLNKIMVKDFNKKPSNVKTMYIGVDEKYFSSSEVSNRFVKKSLGIDENRPVVLFICRLCAEKRPFLMLKIADECRKIIPNIAFVVVGDGELFFDVKKKAKEYKLDKTVYFANSQTEVKPYYNEAEISLICSIKEGLALTSYESMSMGVPVVSSDVGGQKELVDSKVGALVPLLQDERLDLFNFEYSQSEISNYVFEINNLLTNKELLRKLKSASRDRIVNSFSKSNLILQFEKELDNINSSFYVEKRNKISNSLNITSNLTDDFVLAYCEISRLENEISQNIESILEAKNYFEFLYLQSLGLSPKSLPYKILRFFFGILKAIYRKFISNTKLGSKYRKIKKNFKKKNK